MNSPVKTMLTLAACAAATACGGMPMKKFTFDAIDVNERPRPCLIVVNDDWVDAWDKNQVVNVAADDELQLDVAFPSSTIEITVAPLTVSDNRITNRPMSRKDARDMSGFNDEIRQLKLDDPAKHLFILTYKPGS